MTEFDAIAFVLLELDRAKTHHPPFNSAHEGFAVLLEEVDELKTEVWKDSGSRRRDAMRHEAGQVATMALRFMVDVCK